MPLLGEAIDLTPSGSDFRSDSKEDYQKQQIVSDGNYVANAIPGYNEKPLSEQLEPIAVLGMGCRLPGDVKSASQFWELMMSKGTGQNPKVPDSRFNIDAHIHSNNDRPGSFNALGGYFLNETLQEFDPSFFGITPVEAMWMDPQQRKVLEVVYESFESAGVSLDHVAGTDTAVFAASFTADFQQMCFKEPSFRHSLAATGVDPGILSNRISHVFNLKGPSIVVNTACSSSVYALHNASNALRNNECSAAVVAGVNLVLTVDQHMNTAKLGVLSPTSTCHTFDASADGYGRAEGVGAVYLKRLSDAVRDGDPIRAVIRSSATNNNGRVPTVGITHPNRNGQVDVISAAYKRGGDLDPRLTGYFECHGTGTAVGDPLEVHAVSLAMNQKREHHDGPLFIGAVKTNIGHSEAASGLSALIKGVLAVEKGIIPPTRGVENPSPAIQWKDWRVVVPTEPLPFPNLPLKRVSINSFGYGGTNAHVIVESADSLLTQKQSYKSRATSSKRDKSARGAFSRNRPHLLLFSAHDKHALQRNFKAHDAVSRDYSLLDLAYTLGNRRTVFSSRGFTVISHAPSRKDGLGTLTIAENREKPVIGFIFTGQGAQWARMGAELMAYYPSFLSTIRRLDDVLDELVDAPDWTLEDTLLLGKEISPVDEAEFAQPLTTAIQVALVELLRVWGVSPTVTVGHSSGEIAASYAAGHISASEAIVYAYYRGLVVKHVQGDGAMLAVGLGSEAVEPYLARTNSKVVIACHNSPAGVTLSGAAPEIEKLQKELSDATIFARVVKTGGKAYHSEQMASAAQKYETFIREAKKGVLPFDLPISNNARMVSSVTNSVLDKDQVIDETYFSRNLKQPVLFNQALHTLLKDAQFSKVNTLIEIGPHSAMSGPIRQIKTTLGLSQLEYLPSLLRGEDAAAQMLKLAGQLFLRNYPLDIETITSVEQTTESGKTVLRRGSCIVDLPPYQWGRNTYWAESRHSAEHRHPKKPRHDLLGSLVPGASLSEPIWRNFLRIRDVPWLVDHSLGGEAVFPAAAYFSMAIEAITQLTETSADNVEIESYTLRDVSIKKALVTPDDDIGIEIMLNMRRANYQEGKGEHMWWEFNISSIDQNCELSNHMIGNIAINVRLNRPQARNPVHLTQKASGREWNRALRAVGFDYGPTFADMTDVEYNGRDYFCRCKTQVKTEAGNMDGESRHVLHPATVDSTLQLMIASIYAGRTQAMAAAIAPVQVDEVCIWPPSNNQLGEGSVMAWTNERGLRSFVCGNQLVASNGQVLMELSNMRGTLYEAAIPQSASSNIDPMPYGKMVWKSDVDLVQGVATVDEFVCLAVFKNPGTKVLDLSDQCRMSLLQELPRLDYVTLLPEDKSTDADLTGFPYANLKRKEADKPLLDQGLSLESFDIVIATEGVYAHDHLHQLCSKSGTLILKSGTDVLISRKAALPGGAHGTAAKSAQVHLVHCAADSVVVEAVQRSLVCVGHTVQVAQLLGLESTPTNVIFVDFTKDVLFNLSEAEFEALQKLIDSAENLLWATAGGLLSSRSAESAMVSGMMRVIRAEQASINVVTVDYDPDTTTTQEAADDIAFKFLRQVEGIAPVEREYCVLDGQTYISRLLPNQEVNTLANIDNQRLQDKFFDTGMRLAGRIQSGKVVYEAEKEAAELRPGAVEIKVSLTGLNRESVHVINGSDISTVLSHEISGTVERVGHSVQGLAVGDRVVGFNLGNLNTHQIVSDSLVQKVGDEESLSEMVSLIMPYATVVHGLKSLARVQRGEKVLILEGTGLVSGAAIEVCYLLGAMPYVVVSDSEEAQTVLQRYGVGQDQIFCSQQELLAFLRRHDSGSDIDVVFSSGWTSETTIREAWRTISAFGRFVSYGRKQVFERGAIDPVPFHRGANYHAFDVVDLYRCKPVIFSKLLQDIVKLYRENRISVPQPLVTKNIANVNEAVSSFRDSFKDGKTILEYKAFDKPIQMIPSVPKSTLRSDATYLLVGCLGGLGRSLTSWMLKKGARHFCFLSRSGADAKSATKLVKDLEASGAVVTIVRGDVSVLADVRKVISGIPSSRPLRGVIHAAMVLRDSIFQTMKYQDWVASISPKVKGAANLDAALGETNLDFFVVTSSVSGIMGTPGQANYAAGNAFLDALCRQRRQRGLNACSVILPMVLGVGVVAENTKLETSLTQKGMYGIDEEHLLRSLELAIEQQQPDADGHAIDHLVIGLDPAALSRAVKEAGNHEPFYKNDERFKSLVHLMSVSVSAGESAGANVLASMLASPTTDEAVRLARDHVVGKLSRMLLVDLDVFEEDVGSIASYGIDSMIGAELRNWIFKEFAMDIPFQQLLSPTLTTMKLGEKVCVKHGIIAE